jgi:carbamoyl-phosphate synthase large subunit
LDLARHGVLEKYNVEMIAASREAIDMAEDRDLFRQAMSEIGLESPRADIAHSLEEALEKQAAIGFPTIIRPSFTLGGTGGGIAYNREEFERIITHGLEMSPTTEVLIEESVIGWKEFEMEVVRDRNDNCIIVCAIENFDPMGVHTGDSITVAPAQTLTDKEYQRLRNASIDVLRKIGVETGGSNVQFAICPDTGRVLIIEMNPRVSRSSALASKATGFPIAKVAAKLAVGYTLDELKNDITGGLTPASFEPAIDYVVTKIPRFTFEKFPGANDRLTTQMKSVGEVMAIGRSFQESLQKALRGTETGISGLNEICGPIATDLDRDHLRQELRIPGPDRLLYVADAMRHGYSFEDVANVTGIDPWFLVQIADLVNIENEIRESGLPGLNESLMRAIKRKGFSDTRIAELIGCAEAAVRRRRLEMGVRPVFKRVDTCAAEFATTTAYMYSTYEEECEAEPTDNAKIMILGGGPNRIGQGIEFDYHGQLQPRDRLHRLRHLRSAVLRVADIRRRHGDYSQGTAERRHRAVWRPDTAETGARPRGGGRPDYRHLTRFNRFGRRPRALPEPGRESWPQAAAQQDGQQQRAGTQPGFRRRLPARRAAVLRPWWPRDGDCPQR